MSDDIIFEIPMNPVAKARARSARLRNGHTIHYTPAQTVKAETFIREHAVMRWGHRPIITEAISMDVINYLPIPRSWSPKKTQSAIEGKIHPISRPDWDNYGKLVSDSLNGIVYKDDSLVVDGRSRKVYSLCPRIRIIIRYVNGSLI